MGIKIVKSMLMWMCIFPCWSFHLWKNDNQQAFDLFQTKRFKEAQELFNSLEWKGIAAYRNQDYANAIRYLSQVQNAESYYNLGNSYAHLGQLEEAIKAYKNAILIDPQHVDAAFNMQVLEKEIQRQEEERKRQEEERKRQEEERKRQEEERKRQEEEERKRQEEDQQKNNPEQGGKEQNNKEENDMLKEDLQANPQEDKLQAGQQNQEWLNFIDEDPSALLKQKFLRDYQKAQQEGRI